MVPAAKPVCFQLPSEDVCAGVGTVPVPETLLKVIVTPSIPVALLVVTLPEALKGGGGAVIENVPLEPVIAGLDVLVTTIW